MVKLAPSKAALESIDFLKPESLFVLGGALSPRNFSAVSSSSQDLKARWAWSLGGLPHTLFFEEYTVQGDPLPPSTVGWLWVVKSNLMEYLVQSF